MTPTSVKRHITSKEHNICNLTTYYDDKTGAHNENVMSKDKTSKAKSEKIVKSVVQK